jgi:hypothetical protein
VVLIHTALNVTQHQQDVLAQVQAKLPSEAQGDLERALQASQSGYAAIEERLTHPSLPTASASWTPLAQTMAPPITVEPAPTQTNPAPTEHTPALTPRGVDEPDEITVPSLTATHKASPVVPSPRASSTQGPVPTRVVPSPQGPQASPHPPIQPPKKPSDQPPGKPTDKPGGGKP